MQKMSENPAIQKAYEDYEQKANAERAKCDGKIKILKENLRLTIELINKGITL